MNFNVSVKLADFNKKRYTIKRYKSRVKNSNLERKSYSIYMCVCVHKAVSNNI